LLTIRDEQMKILSRMPVEKFVSWMRQRLGKVAPDRCAELGEERTVAAIRLGVARASGYGMPEPEEWSKYVALMFTLGLDFDTDPRLPWAQQILTGPTPADGAARMARLYETAKAFLRGGGP
jgi:hypothetical protein